MGVRPFLSETLGLWAKYIAILFEVPKQFVPWLLRALAAVSRAQEDNDPSAHVTQVERALRARSDFVDSEMGRIRTAQFNCCTSWIGQCLFQNPSPSAFHLQIQQVRDGGCHVQVVNVPELLAFADSPAAQDQRWVHAWV